MKVLVTGGAGYIGRHVALALLEAGHTVHLLDNLATSSLAQVRTLEELVQAPVPLHLLDLAEDVASLRRLLAHQGYDGVVHLAALKSVPESLANPLQYYHVNLTGTLNLLYAMEAAGCRRLVFSSSATVYGPGAGRHEQDWPHNRSPTSPYGLTKDVAERVIRGLPDPWAVTSLRYFNPLGAHPSGRLGDPGSANVMGALLRAARDGAPFTVHGTAYETPDGTCIRDYVHVMDVAAAHVVALERAQGKQSLNVGTGRGTSVRELVAAMVEVSGQELDVREGPARAGDVAISTAATGRIAEAYGWQATRSLADMCRSAWQASLQA